MFPRSTHAYPGTDKEELPDVRDQFMVTFSHKQHEALMFVDHLNTVSRTSLHSVRVRSGDKVPVSTGEPDTADKS